jgi:hypothetical protein
MLQKTVLGFAMGALLAATACEPSAGSKVADSKGAEPEMASAKAPEESTLKTKESLRGDIPHENPECRACREAHCTNWEGQVNLVDLCFANEDPKFNEQCITALNCAYKAKCGHGRLAGAECYCGKDVEPPDCLKPGGAQGPCQEEWYAAARPSSLQDFSENFGDIKRPSGAAYYLQNCDRELCKMCLP